MPAKFRAVLADGVVLARGAGACVEVWPQAEYEAQLEKNGQQFTAKLHHIDGKKPEIPNKDAADRILKDLKGRQSFEVTEVKRCPKRPLPDPIPKATLVRYCGTGTRREMRTMSARFSPTGQRLLVWYRLSPIPSKNRSPGSS